MTTNEREIRKAHEDFRENFLNSKKQEWIEIRKNNRLDRKTSIHHLVNSGIDIKEARFIIDRDMQQEQDAFRFDAVNEIRRKKRQVEQDLKVKTPHN